MKKIRLQPEQYQPQQQPEHQPVNLAEMIETLWAAKSTIADMTYAINNAVMSNPNQFKGCFTINYGKLYKWVKAQGNY